MAPSGWHIHLGERAEADFAAILVWTAQTFGAQQARIYQDNLIAAISALAGGPKVPGSIARDEILAGVRSLHIAS